MQTMSTLTRRELLFATASSVIAAACNSDDATNRAGAGRATAERPASLNDVDHVVILLQENRSFDHYFGTRKGVRGFADPNVLTRTDGRPIWYQDSGHHRDGFVLPFHMDSNTSAACRPDPAHGWVPQHVNWADGQMTGFGALAADPMGYFTREDIPYYYALADEFTLCDHSFCSVIGPTTPNRLYAWSATIDPGGTAGGPVIDNLEGPFRWETYPERLTKAGISWRVYHEADDFDDNTLKYFAAFQRLGETDELYDAAIRNRPAGQFASDVQSGDLPAVSWIVAPMALSEHPSAGAPFAGIDFTARTLAALMANKSTWAKSLFILTFDENGGYFDHVAPPVAPPGTSDEFAANTSIGPGFRVPTIVASPWSRGGKVDSTVFDHTSTLRLLETRFGVEIPHLSEWRRATCGDLSTVLDFSSTDTTIPELPATADGAERTKACAASPKSELPSIQTMPVVPA